MTLLELDMVAFDSPAHTPVFFLYYELTEESELPAYHFGCFSLLEQLEVVTIEAEGTIICCIVLDILRHRPFG